MNTNYLKKGLALLLTVLMLMTILPLTLFASAAGTGTEANPYQITTAAQLQAINNNVTAHYKLMNNIDLSGMDFIPLGNADSGAFSGSFDGNGYTISNLSVYAGKYAGLFGCNEGTVKNVILSQIDVYGTCYLGGVVAQNTALGTIQECKVLSGKITSDGGLANVYAGGICGYNKGDFKGTFFNACRVSLSSNNSILYAGGIVGYFVKSLQLSNLCNKGAIIAKQTKHNSNDAWQYVGGIFGDSSSSIKISKSVNNGVIKAVGHRPRAGGLIGIARGNSDEINNSFNTGRIESRSLYECSTYAGGLIGESLNSSTISESFNTASVFSFRDNNSYTSYREYIGGLIGKTNNVCVENSYNTGNLVSGGHHQIGGGIVGNTEEIISKVNNSYSTGNLVLGIHSGSIGGHDFDNYQISNSLSLNTSYSEKHRNEIVLNETELKSRQSLFGWNFDDIWAIDSNVNGGFPYLKNCIAPLNLNCVNKTLLSTDTLQLKAYKNGNETSAVTWSVTAGEALVNSSGKIIYAGVGFSTITATDSEGNKANCNIYGMLPNTSVTTSNFSTAVGNTIERTVDFGKSDSGDFISNITSSDENILQITSYGDNKFTCEAISGGTATISIETAQGYKCSCVATVTNKTTRISLSKSSLTLKKGYYTTLTATPTPNPTSSTITWESSDPSIATVDENGKVVGKGIGTATISVKTDNGYSAACTVTVTAPVTAMAFEEPTITVYKGDSRKLGLVIAPINTTDSVKYSSSSTTKCTVDSATGTINAKTAGNVTITATADSGEKAYCNITILDYPNIVTGVALDKAANSIKVGEVFKLTATIAPTNATDKTITWESTDNSVADVSSGGIVEGKGAGKAIITATSSNGIIASCEVNVTGVAGTNISRIYVPKVLNSQEDYVDIPVIIENNPGISFANISVVYDKQVLEPIEVTNGTVFGTVLGSIDKEQNTVKLIFNSETDIGADGVLATIRYKVLDKTVSGQVRVNYFPQSMRNVQARAVALNLEDGALKVSQVNCKHKNKVTLNKEAALCESNGYSGDIYCEDCDCCLTTGTIIEALGHNYGKWTVTKKATCQQEGSKTRVCSRDASHTETESIPLADHIKSAVKRENVVSATCTESGSYTGVINCTVCSKELSRQQYTIPALGHNYVQTTIAPKATALGYTLHKCSRCDDAYQTDYSSPTGKVSGLKCKTRKANEQTLSWTAVKGACSYVVKISDKTGKKWEREMVVTGNSCTVKKLTAGCNYKFKVKFSLKAGDGKKYHSNWSATIASPTLPSGTTITKLTSGKNAFTAQWKKALFSGYQIQYCTNSKFSKPKTITVKNAKTLKATVKKLSAKKVYYVRIRTYKTISKANYYSAWSKTYKVKTK